MEALIKAGVFDKLEERNKLLKNLDRLLEYARQAQKTKLNGQQGLFDGFANVPKIYLEPAKEATLKEKLLWEKELLGLYVSGHPLKPLEKILQKKAVPIAKIRESMEKESSFTFVRKIMPGTRIKVAGLINKIKRIITKNGKPMLFVEVEDLSEKIETIVFPGVIEKNPTALQENKIVFISGRIDLKDEAPKIIAEEIEELIEES